jgi:hypothetical protein
MKPWQTPFNKAPNKGREKKGQERAESKEQKKNNPSIFLATYLYSWLPTGTYYKILCDLDLFSFALSLSLFANMVNMAHFFSLRKIISIISGDRIFQLEI